MNGKSYQTTQLIKYDNNNILDGGWKEKKISPKSENNI